MFQLTEVKYGSEWDQDNHFLGNFLVILLKVVLAIRSMFLLQLCIFLPVTRSGVRTVNLLSDLIPTLQYLFTFIVASRPG